LKVLDPACGSGNFLYVSLELMKRLEAEVLEAFEELGGDAGFEMASFKIGPRQFLGLELNRRAVAIAQLVLWIGFFQWQRKTTGKADTNERPLLPKTPSILQQDAVLAYDAAIPRKDPDTGEVVTIWDGITTKPHPITGNEVPDDSARKVVFDYTNPRRAEWPAADVIVGNPPFIGVRKMIPALGEGYVAALRKAYPDVPETSDLVAYWWQKAALLLISGSANQFGLITTNSITQEYSRGVLEKHLDGEKPRLALKFAVADHPWVDSADGAAVRIAMTVACKPPHEGVLLEILEEETSIEDFAATLVATRERVGRISSRLKIADSATHPVPLGANAKMCFQGVVPAGDGFKIGSDSPLAASPELRFPIGPVRSYLIGKDLVQRPEQRFIFDCFGLSVAALAEKFPAVYQHLLVNVKPERDENRRQSYKEKWWIFAEPRPALRSALSGISRYIGTPYTAKYRPFVFLDVESIPDAMVYAIASEDAFTLGTLSSCIHLKWSVHSGGTLEDRPRYNSNGTFLPFPFPALEEGTLKQRIRDLGERLDAHRKRQQELHPDLTLTGLYNVLEAIRAGRPLNAKEKAIHDKGLVSILKQIHDDLDLAVFEAYGWPDLGAVWKAVAIDGCTLYDRASGTLIQPDLDPAADFDKMLAESRESLEQEILSRLVTLNHERAAEEKRGLVRWLRPDYQAPGTAALPAEQQDQIQLTAGTTAAKAASLPDKLAWPDGLAAQVAAVQKLVPALGPDPEAIAARFGKKSAKRAGQITEILETLRGLGKL
jgi:hypothetical protein